MESMEFEPRVAVVGVGGAGCNVVSKVYNVMPSADAIAINCDREAMHSTRADKKLYICRSVTNGEGARGDAALGRECARAHISDIEKALTGYDAVFIVAGMGGGTGTGAAPVIAEKARSMGMMTFAIAINPFSFESARRQTAKEGASKLRQVCPGTVFVENDAALEGMSDATMSIALDAVNSSVASFIQRKTEFITKCFGEEFEAVCREAAEMKACENTVADIEDSVGARAKTAKE